MGDNIAAVKRHAWQSSPESLVEHIRTLKRTDPAAWRKLDVVINDGARLSEELLGERTNELRAVLKSMKYNDPKRCVEFVKSLED